MLWEYCMNLVTHSQSNVGLTIFILNELIRDVLLWIPTHGRAKAGRPARTYIQQLCEDTGCCPEDLPRAMNDREEWRERVRDIRATSAIWWWRWFWIVPQDISFVPYPQATIFRYFNEVLFPNSYIQHTILEAPGSPNGFWGERKGSGPSWTYGS